MKKYDFMKLNSIEPFWKLLLGNKALLPFLYSMYPNSKYLLPSSYDDPRLTFQNGTFEYGKPNTTNADWVSKPIFGREGLGVFFSSNFTKKYGPQGFDRFVYTTENNFGRLGGEKLG